VRSDTLTLCGSAFGPASLSSITTEEFDLQDSQYAGDLVTGTLGNGGPPLTIATDTGDVELTRLD